MKSITIRNVPDEVHRRLRIRAARNGRSLEAELRTLLGAVVRVNAESQTTARRAPAAGEIMLTKRDYAIDAAEARQKVRRILE